MLDQLQTLYNSGSITEDHLKQKLQEAIDNLPEEHKMKLKAENVDLIELIMNFIKSKKPEAETEKPIEEESGRKKVKRGIFSLIGIS